MQSIDESGLFEACRVLFGEEPSITRGFLRYIRYAGLKSAFRKKAFATHPDRIVVVGEEFLKQNAEPFREVLSAYKRLNDYIKWRDEKFKDEIISDADYTDVESHFSKQKKGFTKRLLPGRHLNLGELLYYSGIISWENLIAAIAWQKKSRQRLGEIADHWKLASEPLIEMLLKNRHEGERIGEVLLRNRIITPFQLKLLLWQQQKNQISLGEYFITEGLLTKTEIKRYKNFLKEHNMKYRHFQHIIS